MGATAIRQPLPPAGQPRSEGAAVSPFRFDEPLEFARRLSALHHHVVRHQLRRGARLIVEDDEPGHLYVLAKGWIVKYKSSVDGRRQIVDFALPGEVLGLIRARRAPYAMDMLTDGEVLSIPRCVFDGLVSANAELAIHVCRQLEAAETRAYDRIASIGHRSARLRVARLLLEFIARLGRNDGERQVLPLPLKQQHIGDALGLRVETVCRVMVQLREAGIVVLRRGRLHVLDQRALIAESEATGDDEPNLAVRLRRMADRPLGPMPLSLMASAD